MPIFASGPMSHIFTGVHEQTFIAHGMAYAACIGRNKQHCVKNGTRPSIGAAPSLAPELTATVLIINLIVYITNILV